MKNLKLHFQIIILSLLLYSCKKRRDEPNPTEAIVKGTIFSTQNSYKEIHGAIISLDNKKRNKSHSDGTFLISNVSPNTYNVIVSHSQYKNDTSELTVIAGDIITHPVPLEPIAPILSLTDEVEALDFGLTTNSLTFTIENIGIGSLTWELVFEEESWFSVSDLSGTGNLEISVTINREELLEGTYQSEIIVKNKEFDNDVDTIDIHVVSEKQSISFKPGAEEGKDSHIRFHSDFESLNYSDKAYLNVSYWTRWGYGYAMNSVIEFTDLKSLTNVEIVSAELIFHDGSYYDEANFALWSDYVVNGYDNDNTIDLYLVTEEWEEDEVTPINAPSYSTAISAEIARSNDRSELKISDVTALVQETVDHPDTYFGFYMVNRTQSRYRSMMLASSDSPNSEEHPELKVVYIQR